MANEEKDLSVREATLVALESSKKGLTEIKEFLSKSADFFDAGNDRQGLVLIASEVIPRIKAFFGFCKSISDTNSDIFNDELIQRMAVLFIRSDKVMKSLFKETEAKNYTEVGDILRFDFNDLLSEYASIIPCIEEAFKSSKKPALDAH